MDRVNHSEKRGVLFLRSDSIDKFINAYEAQFGETLRKTKLRRNLRDIADNWLGDGTTKRHHGWNKGEQDGKYVECYVFKPPPSFRFYGFILHPKWDARFQVFVIVHQTSKHESGTDWKILDGVLRLRDQPELIEIVSGYRFLAK
jgi:hypothetical protein